MCRLLCCQVGSRNSCPIPRAQPHIPRPFRLLTQRLLRRPHNQSATEVTPWPLMRGVWPPVIATEGTYLHADATGSDNGGQGVRSSVWPRHIAQRGECCSVLRRALREYLPPPLLRLQLPPLRLPPFPPPSPVGKAIVKQQRKHRRLKATSEGRLRPNRRRRLSDEQRSSSTVFLTGTFRELCQRSRACIIGARFRLIHLSTTGSSIPFP
mmetsp:Transcript_37406/g.66979  ORF Transcript_37406/g.66979 Transcript_37406/m.66979 type:complete len:210 (-) Transcript_37406:387-1016(-)